MNYRGVNGRQIAMASMALLIVMALGVRAEGPATTSPAATQSTATKIEKQATILAAAEKSMVIVEYTLQYDKGEAPRGQESLMKEERPLEEPGVVVEANHVISDDVQIHPRFIKSIAVRKYTPAGKDVPRVAAKVFGYPTAQHCVILEMAGPLVGTQAATFDAKREGTLSVVVLTETEGDWAVRSLGLGSELGLVRGKKQLVSEARGLVVDSTGAGVGILPSAGPIPADDTWKGSPMKWPMISAAEMEKTLAALDAKAQKGIVKVMLNFRSPKGGSPEEGARRGADSTVQYVLGVMVNDKTVVVLTELKPNVTARLERIKVFTEPAVEAKFTATLADYGAFVATLEKPVSGAGVGLSKAGIENLTWQELATAEIFMQGEKRVSYVQPMRIEGLTVGWRRNVYPEVASDSRGNGMRGLFVFDGNGALAALPVSVRQKASTDERYGPSQIVTPIEQLAAVLDNLKINSDKDNVPLSEEEENRIAWVGFEMQAMNQELARANNVSDQTNDGETGALVTYVYPDSPAAKAGVEPGWVLLRIDAEGQPKPIEVHVDADPFSDQPFPWERLDGAPESVFDRIFMYTPWPRAANSVVRSITEVGFGKKYTIEFFHDGKVDKKDFVVAEGPAHFDTAPKYKDAGLGLTVKDMTYEVRRYMQKKLEDPGVIVGKIEMGSKASKAGIKPYEVITHVNDQPVMNVKDFEKLTKGQEEVRLSVKRMTKGRIVKIKVTDAAASQPATKAAEPDDTK